MIVKTCRYALITILAIFVVGCVDPLKRHPAPVEKVQPESPQPAPPAVSTVPALPEIAGRLETGTPEVQPAPPVRKYQWDVTLQPLVKQMLQADGVSAGSVLLVDSVNNRTNGALDINEATTMLRNALNNNGKFTLVSPQQLSIAKQQLGLSPKDSLGSRSKAMGIARTIGVQYVLYSSATGSANQPELNMQLMLVQTGEIIWSGNGAVQQQ